MLVSYNITRVKTNTDCTLCDWLRPSLYNSAVLKTIVDTSRLQYAHRSTLIFTWKFVLKPPDWPSTINNLFDSSLGCCSYKFKVSKCSLNVILLGLFLHGKIVLVLPMHIALAELVKFVRKHMAMCPGIFVQYARSMMCVQCQWRYLCNTSMPWVQCSKMRQQSSGAFGFVFLEAEVGLFFNYGNVSM